MHDELVTIATTPDIIEAELFKSQIEDEGIEVFLADENLIGADVLLANALGGIKIKVLSENAAAASEIVAEVRAGNAACDNDKNEDTGWGECPKCHCKNLKPFRNEIGWRGALALLKIPVVRPQRMLRCNNCGNEWKNPET
ncbi:MAG: DUF2007 domain-containing protein [Pyrinomonadaceae bacterium]